jgi:hypothetical protein
MTRSATVVLSSVVALLILLPGCTALESLGTFVRAPQFDEAPNRPAEIRLLPPSAANIAGGAGVRLWAEVTNPNPFGFTLSTLAGTLYVEETPAATVDLPLGLPLEAGGSDVFPIDVALSFARLPELAGAIQRAANDQPVPYRFEGTVGVQAGRLGTPVFGPMTLLSGSGL